MTLSKGGGLGVCLRGVDDKTPPVEAALILRTLGASRTGGTGSSGRRGGQTAFALRTLAGQLAGAANGFGLLTGLLLGRLLVVVPQLHLAENAFALQLFLQRAQRLVDIVIANNYLQAASPFVNRHQLLK